MPVDITPFIAARQHTVFGNVYWGNDGYAFFDNSIQNTLLMYRLLRKSGLHEEMMSAIRAYFLEERKGGHWRNTYESSLILETILPELLDEKKNATPVSITISGKDQKKVTEFPFQTEIASGDKTTISKSGTMPVYFTAHQQRWNRAPGKVDGNFMVSTYFESDKNRVSKLKAGDPVVMKIEVTVEADADYVMIEIPIPAGCSYHEKNQSRLNGEVHREYFKNKVSIFCSRLEKGEYQFRVSLLPRYTGVYTLNPAKAEMMYFPVFYGREALRKTVIQ